MHDIGLSLLILLFNGSVVTALFVVLLLNHKKVRRSRSNLFLSILLVALAFSVFHFNYAAQVIRHFANKMYSPGDPTFLVIAPLAWFYAIELTGERVRLSWRLLLHFLPFLIVVYLSLTASGESNPLSDFILDNRLFFHILFRVGVVMQFALYTYHIHKKWLLHQQLLQQEVSNTENVNIAWLRFFFIVFLVISLFFLLSLITIFHNGNHGWLPTTTALLFAATIYTLSFRGILQRDIFDTVKPALTPQPAAPLKVVEIPQPVVPAHLPDQALIDKLLLYMNGQKPYLDPELSLSNLAGQLKITRNQLSQLINEGLHQNFYDFVNKYRVEEVKRLMADPSFDSYNLLGIAFEAGFKSKSTFNLIFKRFTGLTPTEYRKNQAYE